MIFLSLFGNARMRRAQGRMTSLGNAFKGSVLNAAVETSFRFASGMSCLKDTSQDEKCGGVLIMNNFFVYPLCFGNVRP